MVRPNRKTISRFGDRLDWVRTNLVAGGPVKHPAEIQNDRDLRLAVSKFLEKTSPHNNFSDKTWARWRKDGNVSEAALATIRAMYPVTIADGLDLFACEWESFEKATGQASVAQTRWLAATEHFRKSRGQVERFGKAVYECVDQLGAQLPLIGLRAWLPPAALPLERGENTSWLRWAADHSEIGRRSISLPGLWPPYHLLKFSALRRTKEPPFNGECYLISELGQNGQQWEFKLRRGRYFDYIDTCEAHAALLSDLINHGAEHNAVAVDRALEEVGWTRNSVLDWRSRTTFAGVNCLLITTNYHETDPSRGKTRFWLHRRSTTTIEAQGVWHVAPAGGHQPLSKGHANPEEMGFWYTAARELLEEIFGRNDLAVHGRDTDDPFKREQKTNAIFRSVIESGAAKFYYLGIGLDPATTKPEVLCAIVLDWGIAEKSYYIKNNTHLRKEMTDHWEGDLQPFAFSLERMRAMAEVPHPGETMLPAGAACLLLTASHIENGSISLY